MGQRYYPGNTLSEYAIIITLIVVASYAALCLMGNSVSGHYNELSQGNSGTALKKMSHMDFSGQAPGASSNPMTLSSKGLYLQLTSSSSGGVNATSLDGIQDTSVGRVIGAANQLKLLAQTVTDPALKALLQAASDNALQLSTTEAAIEYMSLNDRTGIMAKLLLAGGLNKVSMKDAVNSVDTYRTQIEGKLAQLDTMTNVNPAEVAQARQLLDSVVTSSWNEYGKLIEATDTLNAKTYTPNVIQVKAVAATAQANGSLADTKAIETAVDAGLRLDNP